MGVSPQCLRILVLARKFIHLGASVPTTGSSTPLHGHSVREVVSVDGFNCRHPIRYVRIPIFEQLPGAISLGSTG